MQQRTPSKSGSRSADKKIPRPFWIRKAESRVHKTMDPFLCQMTAVNTLTIYFCEMHFNRYSKVIPVSRKTSDNHKNNNKTNR
jgi:hypothetical protein